MPVVIIASRKGGAGKTLVAIAIGAALVAEGSDVGLLDADSNQGGRRCWQSSARRNGCRQRRWCVYKHVLRGAYALARPLKTLTHPARPDVAALRQLATADPTLQPAVVAATGSEVINLRVSPDLIDQLDAAAERERTTRKVMITRALAAAGYRVRPADLEDRTPKPRRSRRAVA